MVFPQIDLAMNLALDLLEAEQTRYRTMPAFLLPALLTLLNSDSVSWAVRDEGETDAVVVWRANQISKSPPTSSGSTTRR